MPEPAADGTFCQRRRQGSGSRAPYLFAGAAADAGAFAGGG
jgi:hypothetical protein